MPKTTGRFVGPREGGDSRLTPRDNSGPGCNEGGEFGGGGKAIGGGGKPAFTGTGDSAMTTPSLPGLDPGITGAGY